MTELKRSFVGAVNVSHGAAQPFHLGARVRLDLGYLARCPGRENVGERAGVNHEQHGPGAIHPRGDQQHMAKAEDLGPAGHLGSDVGVFRQVRIGRRVGRFRPVGQGLLLAAIVHIVLRGAAGLAGTVQSGGSSGLIRALGQRRQS